MARKTQGAITIDKMVWVLHITFESLNDYEVTKVELLDKDNKVKELPLCVYESYKQQSSHDIIGEEMEIIGRSIANKDYQKLAA